MSYIQNASSDRKTRKTEAQAASPFTSGPLVYLVFSVAFLFTAAMVLGLIP